MDQALKEAILTSIIGMLTVFLILFVIVVAGYLLMKILERTNFIFNEDELANKNISEHSTIIQRAISKWSGGKAEIKNIKKLN